MWTDPHISKKLLELHINPNHDIASRSPEKIDKLTDWILEKCNKNKMDILDLGCGPGLYAEIMAQKHEDDLPAGNEGDPGFADPANYKYTLVTNSACRTSGINLGDSFSYALDPDATNMNKVPLLIAPLKHPAQGLWARGAFSYNQTQASNRRLNPPLNLRPKKK